LYTETKKNTAKEALVAMGQSVISKWCAEGKVLAFTGDCGLMQKIVLDPAD
jgi:hypothetical protein